MIKDTPYFAKALKMVNENKFFPQVEQIELEKYYSDNQVIIKTEKDVWILGDNYYDSLDREERNLVENVFDKNKPVGMFMIKEVMIKENFLEEQVFASKNERSKWLKENSALFRKQAPNIETFIDVGLGSACGLVMSTLPTMFTVMTPMLNFLTLPTLLGGLFIGMSAGVAISNEEKNKYKTNRINLYKLSVQGEKFLNNSSSDLAEDLIPLSDLEYFDSPAKKEQVASE